MAGLSPIISLNINSGFADSQPIPVPQMFTVDNERSMRVAPWENHDISGRS
jgi:hypothetical protein